jgi:integrase
MALYRPTYTDKTTGEKKQQDVWWYEFTFAGRRIRESSKSAKKTIAREAEKNRRAELEKGFNAIEDTRPSRIQTIEGLAGEYLADYRLRNPRSATFAEFALGHITRHLGALMRVDVTVATVNNYQTARLKEKAAPKCINEETGFLLRLLGEQGDMIRAKMRRARTLKLKVRSKVAKAYSPEEKTALVAAAKNRRLPCVHTAIQFGLNAGLRDSEILDLQWGRLDLARLYLTVGDSKTDAGEGRTIPINEELLGAIRDHLKWFAGKFGTPRPDWYVFPYGKPQPTDPTRPMTTLKTAWTKVREDAGVSGRFHDTRHTFITELAESGEAGDETIRDLAGHVSRQMLKHYSHIGMEAKRRAVGALNRARGAKVVSISDAALQEIPKVAVSGGV